MNEVKLNNDTRHQFQTLLDAVALSDRDAEQAAVVYVSTNSDPKQVSRRELVEESQRRAIAMREAGIEERDLVVIARTQDLETIFLFWGALMIGAIPSVFHTVTEKISPELYFSDIPDLISRAGARAVFTTEEFAPLLAEKVDCEVLGTERLRSAESGPLPERRPDPEETAVLQFSSGSTGVKKGIALSHNMILNQLASYSDAIEITRKDVVVSWMPFYHDGGMVAGHILPLLQGILLVLMSPFDWVSHPAMLFQAISQYGGSLCFLPNFAYNHCARRIRDQELAGVSLASVRAFINAAEPVREESHELFLERFGGLGVRPNALTVMYGMAENVMAITQTPMWEKPKTRYVRRDPFEQEGHVILADKGDTDVIGFVSCGSPIPKLELAVVDQEFNRLPEGHVGEFILRSNSMLTGYYKRPDLDKTVTRDGWLLTGDLGFVIEGEAYVSGRKKDLIINAGKNIHPHDLESVANEVPGIHPGRVVAFGIFDEAEGTEVIVVLAETDSEAPKIRAQLRAAIREEIAKKSMVTARYVDIVDRKWMIKTSSGKLARGANREKWLSERSSLFIRPVN